MSHRSLAHTGVIVSLIACACSCSLLASHDPHAEAVETHCGDIAPTVIIDRFAEPQVLHIDALVLSEDVAPQLEAQAAKHSFAATEVASKLKMATAGASQELTRLATRLPNLTVVVDADDSRATMRVTGTVEKLDLVQSKSLTNVIGQATASDHSSTVDFRARVTLQLVKNGVVVATGAGDGKVPLLVERATGGQTVATNKAPATGGQNSSSEELVLSPMKDSVALAADAAWGDLWRSVAAATPKQPKAAVPASAGVSKPAAKP